VHPQKAEIRFSDARGVFDAITRELHAALARAYGLPDLGASPYAQQRPAAPTLEALGNAAAAAHALASATSTLPKTPLSPVDILPILPLGLPETNLFTGAAPLQLADSAAAAPLFGGRGVYASLRYLAQARGTFLLCEGDDGLYVLDQHAAAERVTFDRLRRTHATRAIATQRILVPEVVELTASDVALLEEQAEEVVGLGVELRAVGDSAVAVHALPALLRRADPARVVRDLAGELARTGSRAFGRAVDLVLATMACHGSLRAGDAITDDEARALLRSLDEVDFGGHCPHGRPIVMRLSWGELERRVGR
jgi:DNA mismatch repair protein MutL